MSHKSGKVPAYSRHKHSGQAVVRIDGQDHYLGPYGSAGSHERYERLVGEWRVKRQESFVAPINHAFGKALIVEEVLALYWQFAKGYYVKDGQPTKELVAMKYAMKPLRRLYATLPARDFGPLALKSVRQAYLDADLCRNEVNKRVNRIRRIFKWAVSEELVPATVYEGLRSVDGLRYGRTSARESEPVKPAMDNCIDAIIPFVSPQVAAMIQLQRCTGMRPGEVTRMRPCEIDMSGDVWIYEPSEHKTKWRGHCKRIALGPRAQRFLSDFLSRPSTSYLFSPREAEAWRNLQRRAKRASPMTPSQARRAPKKRPQRSKRERYSVEAYGRAIVYGIRKAARTGVEIQHWHANQLRHNCGTTIRKAYGLEAAQVVLGHVRANVTEVYAEKNLNLAVEVARQLG